MSDSEKLTKIQHTEVATGRPYEALVEAFEHELGHLDPLIGTRLMEQKASWNEVEREMARMAGPRGLMIIFRADQGKITSLSGQEKRCSLYLVGNPVIADQIISIDLRAGFYVPFRVCLYDNRGPDGAVISYDRPSSFLAALGKPELTEFGALLDRKIDDVATALRKRRSWLVPRYNWQLKHELNTNPTSGAGAAVVSNVCYWH